MNKSVDAFGIKIGDIVDGDETSDLGIVVPGLQEVETGFGIEVVTSVPERVQFHNIVRANVGNDGQAVAPSVVYLYFTTVAPVLSTKNHPAEAGWSGFKLKFEIVMLS